VLNKLGNDSDEEEMDEEADDSLINALFADFTEDDILKLLPEIVEPMSDGQTEETIRILREMTANPESRIALLAWYMLREYDVLPALEEAQKILGIVIEVRLEMGIDYLAAYPDNVAIYFNQGGAQVRYMHCDDQAINDTIQKLMPLCGQAVKHFKRVPEKRRATVGSAFHATRINLLTPSGLHVIEGAMSDLHYDPVTKDILAQGVALMLALMKLGPRLI
jgi:hypothetical protein